MTKKCTVKILDEVNCVFVGLHPDHIGYFYETYAKYAPNYYFTPKFKLGQWDGKIRYFYKSGKTYVNLLDSIIPKVVGLGYDVSIQDNRQIPNIKLPKIDKDFFSNITDPETGSPWEMRPYQVRLINTLLESKGGVGLAGTGSGKTSMCAAMVLVYEKAANARSMIIVPDKNLTSQTYKEYAFFGLDVGQYSGDVKDTSHKHIVSTWQSLKNNPTLLNHVDVVIVDECHGIRGDVLTWLLNECGKHIPFRYGVTGTIPKAETDAMSIRIAVGDVKYTVPAHELIEKGYLAKLDIDIIQHDIDLKSQYQEFLENNMDNDDINNITYRAFKDAYFPDWSSEKSYIQGKKTRLEWIANYIEEKRNKKKGNVLCLVNGIRFGKKLSSMVDNSVFVYGNDKVKAREEIYALFENHDNLVVIATINIAGTGLNIKRIFNLIFIDVGRSFIRTIQSIGRGLRKAKDKDSVHVTDMCSDFKYSKRHVRERIKYYKEAQYPYKKQTVPLEN